MCFTVKFLKHGSICFRRSRYSPLLILGRPMDAGMTCCLQSGARKASIFSMSHALYASSTVCVVAFWVARVDIVPKSDDQGSKM